MSDPKYRKPLPDKDGMNGVVDRAIDLGIEINKHQQKVSQTVAENPEVVIEKPRNYGWTSFRKKFLKRKKDEQ